MDSELKIVFDELYCELGLPEAYELESYGISENEFYNPTLDTINKLRDYAKNVEKSNIKRR